MESGAAQCCARPGPGGGDTLQRLDRVRGGGAGDAVEAVHPALDLVEVAVVHLRRCGMLAS